MFDVGFKRALIFKKKNWTEVGLPLLIHDSKIYRRIPWNYSTCPLKKRAPPKALQHHARALLWADFRQRIFRDKIFLVRCDRGSASPIASLEPALVIMHVHGTPKMEVSLQLVRVFESHALEYSPSLQLLTGCCLSFCIFYWIYSLILFRPGEERTMA